MQELTTIDPVAQATVVAGWAGGRNKKIFRVVTAFKGVPESSLEDAFILVCAEEERKDLDAILAVYLNLAPAGILISGYGAALSQGLIDQAEKNHIPLFVCSKRIEEQELKFALELVVNLVQNGKITSISEHYRIRQVTNLRMDLPALLNQLAEYLQNPAILVDSVFQILAQGGTERFWPADELGELVKSARLKIIQHKKNDLMLEKVYQQVIIFNNQNIIVSVKLLLWGNQLLGYLLVFDVAGQLNELDLCQISEVGLSCLQVLISRKNTEEIEKKYKDHFLYDLLYNNFESENALIKRGRYWGWEFGKPHRLLIVEPDDFKQLLNKDQILEQLQSSTTAFLKQHFRHVIISEMQDQIVVIIPGNDDEDKRIKQHLKSLAKLLQNAMQEILPTVTFSVGIGKFYSSVVDLCRSYQEAKYALDLGRFIQEKGHITHFEDLGVIRLLSHVSLDQLDEYYKEHLGVIIEYDEKNNTNYLETLQIYFQQNGDLNLIAEKLFMHSNTLRYRLKKIEELLDADLQKMESRVSLSVACKIVKMRKTNQ
ncbi:PucR family transcriptional regulator [Sporomusa malonica]|uniref:PucR family transcriptional regulator n=1 Tax=Sporomusa malonica TaxID=112901 RepID=UPI001FE37D5C|nr:helix-turn-helix domain-containing protein [Sporomusa malonica]